MVRQVTGPARSALSRLPLGSLAVVTAAALLAGCGGDPQRSGPATSATTSATSFAAEGPEQIAQAGLRATSQASSLRVRGVLVRQGRQVGIDLLIDRRGDCEGQITASHATEQVRSIGGGRTWIKGDDAFWRQTVADRGGNGADGVDVDAILSIVRGKWVPARRVRGLCDLQAILADVPPYSSSDADAVTTRPTTSGGHPVIGLHLPHDDTVIYVRTDAPHYIAAATSSAGHQRISFSQYGIAVDVRPPPSAQTVDLGGS